LQGQAFTFSLILPSPRLEPPLSPVQVGTRHSNSLQQAGGLVHMANQYCKRAFTTTIFKRYYASQIDEEATRDICSRKIANLITWRKFESQRWSLYLIGIFLPRRRKGMVRGFPGKCMAPRSPDSEPVMRNSSESTR